MGYSEKDTAQIAAIAKEAGQIMLSADSGKINNGITEKEGSANFVTWYDKAVQSYIFEKLAMLYPSAVFIGEEDSEMHCKTSQNGISFVIDPIDGTTNFIRGLKKSAVSIGLLDCGRVVCGVVHNPYDGETFTAVKGCGAYLNGKSIHTSERPLDNAIIAFGTAPYYKSELGEKTFEIAKRLMSHCADLRRSGSAAIDFCDLACGRLDIFFEPRLSPWDYAASSLIISEAGGFISAFDKGSLPFDRTSTVVAGTKSTYADAVAVISGVFG